MNASASIRSSVLAAAFYIEVNMKCGTRYTRLMMSDGCEASP